MKIRVITAVVALLFFVPIIYIGGIPLRLVISFLSLVGVYELFTMKKMKYFSIEGLFTSLATLSLVLSKAPIFLLPYHIDSTYLFFLCILCLFIYTVYQPEKFSVESVAFCALSALYIGGGFAGVLQIRNIGVAMLLFIFTIIWSTDSFAYIIGRLIGKHKLAPKISPNKTIEGSLGGVLGSIIVSFIYIYFYNPLNLSFMEIIVTVALISIFGQMGDLVESAYKREYGVKDSGFIFPGHGGVLDRFDSTFFAMFIFQILLPFFN